MNLPDDPVAIEDCARFGKGRDRQFERLVEDVGRGAIGQLVDAEDLNGDIVIAAAAIGFPDDGLRGLIKIMRVLIECARDKAMVDELVSAVRRQQEDVALSDLKRLVVDFDLRVYSQRPAEIGLLRRDDDPMIVRKLLERLAGDAVDLQSPTWKMWAVVDLMTIAVKVQT